MSKHSMNVIGIMIDTEYKDFKLYQIDESWEQSNQGGSSSSLSNSGDGSAEGLTDILKYLSATKNTNNRYVIVYDVLCASKKEHIERLLTAINKIEKNELLPTLISIGHEHSSLKEDLADKVSIIKEVENTGSRHVLFENLIKQEQADLKKTLIATDKAAARSSQTQKAHSASRSNISMMVLGGFIAAVGIAAVAIAFTALSTTTFLVAATITAVGLFAVSAYKNKNRTTPDASLDHSKNTVPI